MRQWNSEQVLGTFSRRLRGRLLVFATALFASAAVVLATFHFERERFADPVLDILARSESPLRDQAQWFHALATRTETPRALLDRHAERLAALTSFLQSRDLLRERLREARQPAQVDTAAIERLDGSFATLGELGFQVDRDRAAWGTLRTAIDQQLRSHADTVQTIRAEAQARARHIEQRIMTHDERLAQRDAEAHAWARSVEGSIEERLDGTLHALSERTAFLRAFQSWWQQGTAPASELERFWERGVEMPRLRGLIELTRLAAEDLESEASSRERLARLQRVQARVPAVFGDQIVAEGALLKRVSDVSELGTTTPAVDLDSMLEHALGWFLRDGDLDLLRDGALAAAARDEARGYAEALRSIPAEADAWTRLQAMGKLAEERFGETGLGTLAHWIAVLDRAHAEGLLERPWAAELRLALVARTFVLPPTGRDAVRYLEEIEDSGAFASLADKRPFSVIGSLARMFGEVLEARKGNLEPGEIAFWNVVVQELLRVLIDADRLLGDAALAASDVVNESGTQRVSAFKNHPSTKRGFAVRGEWNDLFRRDDPQTARRQIGDAVFRALMFAERDTVKNLGDGPVRGLTRPGTGRSPERGATPSATGGRVGGIAWNPLPRASLLVSREDVDHWLELGITRQDLIAWAGRLGDGAGWREGFRVPLEPCPLRADSASAIPELSLELPPGPSPLPMSFEESPFRIDPWQRHVTSMFLSGALLVVLVVLGVLLFRRVLPTSFTIGSSEDGVARLAIAGHHAFTQVRLRSVDGDPLLEATGDDELATLKLHRALPPYGLTFRRRRTKRGGALWVLVPREPRVLLIDDREFNAAGQRLALRGEGFTSNMRVSIGGKDLEPHVEERDGFTSWVARLPEGVLREGRHDVLLHWEGGTVAAGSAVLGRTRLVASSLPTYAFTDDGAVAIEASFTLGNDRGDAIKLWRQGSEGPRERVACRAAEEEGVPGTRILNAALDLPLGRQRIEIDTSSATLTRSVWVLERGTRVLSVVWRDAAGRLVLEQRMLARGDRALLSSTRRSLPSGFEVRAACFCDGNVWIGHDGGVLVIPAMSVESKALTFPGELDWREGDRFSCARSGERVYVALGNEAPGSGRLYTWDAEVRSRAKLVEWADEELLEIAPCGERIVYAARSELYDLAAPEEPLVGAGVVAGTDKARRLLRFLPHGDRWFVIDLQYRLRDLRDPERREVANMAAHGAFLDPLRVLALDRFEDEVELLVRDATDARRVGLLRRDSERRRFPRDAGTWFTFEGEVLAAGLDSDGD